jgi:hypothetical protein
VRGVHFWWRGKGWCTSFNGEPRILLFGISAVLWRIKEPDAAWRVARREPRIPYMSAHKRAALRFALVSRQDAILAAHAASPHAQQLRRVRRLGARQLERLQHGRARCTRGFPDHEHKRVKVVCRHLVENGLVNRTLSRK